MCELVTPMIRSGGADVVYVMPNLQPPITQISQAHRYHETLTRLAPGVRFLMSLFLHSSMTPETIAEAAQSEIIYGVSKFPTVIERSVSLQGLGETLSSWCTISRTPAHVRSPKVNSS